MRTADIFRDSIFTARGLPYYDRVYTYTAVWLFLVDILISILFSSYAGVLKRGYLQELKATVLHTSEVALGVLVILYLLQDAGYLSRMVFVSFWILYTAVSYLCRIQWKRYVQKHLSEKGIRSFVIVTSSDLAEQVVKRIKGNNYYGLKLTGVILMHQSMTGWSYEGFRLWRTRKLQRNISAVNGWTKYFSICPKRSNFLRS